MKKTFFRYLFLMGGLCILATPLVAQSLPLKLYARILQLEDERNLNGDELFKLLKHAAPQVRHRAIVALGRIGDARAVAPLLEYLEKYKDEIGRPLVIFALGEIESAPAFQPLLAVIAHHNHLDAEAARAAEALGKIGSVAANLPLIGAATLERASLAIIKLLPTPTEKLSPSQIAATGWCITALMRLRSPLAVAPLTEQIQSSEPETRAQAANALSRLRLPINEAIPALIAALSENNSFNDVRANAVRALGASNDPRAVLPLINSLNDKATEVEITAIRSLAQLNDPRAIEPLMQLFEPFRASTINVLLEAAAALTTLKAKLALPALLKVREAQLPKRWLEFETAAFKLSEGDEIRQLPNKDALCNDWKLASVIAQAITATFPLSDYSLVEKIAYDLFFNFPRSSDAKCNQQSQPAIERARAKLLFDPAYRKIFDDSAIFNSHDMTQGKPLAEVMLKLYAKNLNTPDAHLRSAIANILAAQGKEESLKPLIEALTLCQNDKDNDAKLAILSALAKYKTEPAIAAIKTALKDHDILVRRHAVNLLKQLNAGDFSSSIGIVQTGRTPAFYLSVITAAQRKQFATITTAKGEIKLEFFAPDAPLTVHNFVTLARKGYFNGLTFHRIVANFVVQGGDPRGTGDGGPGYAIRCEINQRPYGRGALGMALSGKDTGGSQWFITHAPQPHLDGGYTVFGQVVAGMNVVDRLSRDDVMERVVISNR